MQKTGISEGYTFTGFWTRPSTDYPNMYSTQEWGEIVRWSGLIGQHGVGHANTKPPGCTHDHYASHVKSGVLDRSSDYVNQAQNEGSPSHPPQEVHKKRQHCARLQETEAGNNLCRSLSEKLENIETLLNVDCAIDDKLSFLTSVYESAAHSIGYNRKKHQDWFNENSTSLLLRPSKSNDKWSGSGHRVSTK